MEASPVRTAPAGLPDVAGLGEEALDEEGRPAAGREENREPEVRLRVSFPPSRCPMRLDPSPCPWGPQSR